MDNDPYNISNQEEKEQYALGISIKETLQKLNIPVESLTQKHRNLLTEAANHKRNLGVQNLESSTSLLLESYQEVNQEIDEYEILKLKQYNKSLESDITRNDKEIKSLKICLESARETFMNPQFYNTTMSNEIRSLKQKTASYEENLERAKAKFQKLKVPEEYYPKNLDELINQLVSLRNESAELKLRADDVKLSSHLRNQLRILRH